MNSKPFQIGLLIMILISCKSEVEQKNYAVDFGIYETGHGYVLSDTIKSQLTKLRIQVSEEMNDPVIGYCETKEKPWQDSLSRIVLDDNIHFVVTAKPMEEAGEYFTMVAIKDTAYISNSDIKEAVALGDRVEIRFDMQGAIKWAVMTENNIGHQVAFVLDGEIYSMPYVAGVIKSGTALITGLDEEEATRITNLLNGE